MKYPFIKEQDEMIMRTYREIQPDAGRSPVVRLLADKLKFPRWVISRRARDIGAYEPRLKEPVWSEKELKILVFGDQDQIKEAKESGATYVSDEETITKVKNGWTGFDKVLATPEMMPKIALLAKILGPKGLMPNIKNNTVTKNIKETISNLISGNSLEIKNEKDFPIVHTIIGPLSFGEEKLKGNFKSIYETIIVARPPKVKNPYIKSITIKTTMSPSIKLDPDKLN